MKRIFYFCVMKNFILAFLVANGIAIQAQKLSFSPLLNEKISIRAITLDQDKIWYSGTDSKIGFVSLKDSTQNKQVLVSDKKLQFRTIAADKKSVFAINIESPAYFFKINKNDLSYTIVHTDSDNKAFYDALYYDDSDFYVFSDPEPNKKLKWGYFNNDKEIKINYFTKTIILNEGEAAFAASNSNIASSKDYVWLVTGGMSSKIYRYSKFTRIVKAIETPFVHGKASQGMYSIDFYNNNFGIAVGGDYTDQKANINNIATTNDGGETWQIQASGNNAGYMTCVKIRPKSKGKEMIAIGDQHISYSKDFGKTWMKISDEKNLYTCLWVDRDRLVFAGKDRILKAHFTEQ